MRPVSEITAIVKSQSFSLASQFITSQILHVNQDIASVRVKFHEQFLEVPGILNMLLLMATIQNISVIEVVSTATEFIIYIDPTDVDFIFDAILSKFGKNKRDSN